MAHPFSTSQTVGTDLIIVAPPFATVMMPMLGPSIIAAQCKARDIRAKVEYSGLRLAESIGLSLYERIGLSSFSLMLGDLLFRRLAFPDLADPRKDILDYFARRPRLETSSTRFGPITCDDAINALDAVAPFVRRESEIILAQAPQIVGFSTVFQQNLPSIALALELKRRRPDLMLVVGGANVAEPMGAEFLRIAKCFDYAFSGEADVEFPDFVADVLADRQYRVPKTSIQCAQVIRMDEIEHPCFDDYFDQLAGVNLEVLEGPGPGDTLPLETSRGCWWGAKHHCTFCGLNGEDMAFRTKSAPRVVREIEGCLFSRDVRTFQATDNIMSNQFRSAVLPLLNHVQPLDLFFEVKSNLKEDDLDQFVMSGVNTIQPGIESFSTTVLKRIEKGVTGIRNVWLLRECASRRISVTWNLLVDVPGEVEVDLITQVELLPALIHLQPPNGLSPIVIDRFSPYFDHPSAFDIDSVRPLDAYGALYPETAQINELAYHFQANYESAFRRSATSREKIEDAVTNWRQRWQSSSTPPKLYGVMLDGSRMFVEDTRHPEESSRFALDEMETCLLRSFRHPRRVNEDDHSRGLNGLLERRLMVELDGLAVSVVTEPEIGFALQVKRLKVAEFASLGDNMHTRQPASRTGRRYRNNGLDPDTMRQPITPM